MRNTSPRVTVLMPVFNAGAYLRASVESILGQTFTDFEFLIIDDGSVDGTALLLSTYQDSRLRIITNSKNLGLVHSLNLGISQTNGEYIARMDGDDIAMPRRLELQVEEFGRNPDLALLGSAADLIDEQGSSFDAIDLPTTNEEIRRNILWGNKFIHSSVMMRTSVVRALGGYREDAALAEDYALWLGFIAGRTVGNLPERLVQYRVHKQQLSQSNMRQMRHMALKLQSQAWTVLQRTDHAEGVLPPLILTRWSVLRGGIGSYGRDCLHWARIYRRMGNWTATLRFLVSGLVAAPLCTAFYSILLPQNLFTKRSWHRDPKP